MGQPAPVDKRARPEGLDVLRGLAIFGILVVNVLGCHIRPAVRRWLC